MVSSLKGLRPGFKFQGSSTRFQVSRVFDPVSGFIGLAPVSGFRLKSKV